MKVDIKKYFWQLKPSVIKETEKILKTPQHPRFVEKMYTLLSRCDRPEVVFTLLGKDKFIENWPKIHRYWIKKGQAEDFRYCWEAVYENLIKKKGKKIQREGSSSIFKRIGEIIREKRIGKNYSQKDLAIKVGLRQPDISKIEKGKVNITLETLIRLCRVLDIKNIPLKE